MRQLTDSDRSKQLVEFHLSGFTFGVSRGQPIKDKVLPALQNTFTDALSEPQVNKELILNCMGIRNIDRLKLLSLLATGNGLTEAQRLQQLFLMLQKTDAKIFRKFLVVLCNWERYPCIADNCRKMIKDKFPGAVVKVVKHESNGSNKAAFFARLNSFNYNP